MSAGVAVRGLSIGWGDATLVHDITFEVAPGEIFAILGGSGSGKSTLLRYLIGLEKPVKGDIDVGGGGAPDLDRGLPPFGVMFQDGALFGSMTVLENTELPLQGMDHSQGRPRSRWSRARSFASSGSRPPPTSCPRRSPGEWVKPRRHCPRPGAGSPARLPRRAAGRAPRPRHRCRAR